ncbi:hypothetical protein BIW11_05413, partial [Tropilaelaps mercedesae]
PVFILAGLLSYSSIKNFRRPVFSILANILNTLSLKSLQLLRLLNSLLSVVHLQVMTMSSEPPAVPSTAPTLPPLLARSVSAQSLSASGTPTSSQESSVSHEHGFRSSASPCSDDASPLSVHSLPPTPDNITERAYSSPHPTVAKRFVRAMLTVCPRAFAPTFLTTTNNANAATSATTGVDGLGATPADKKARSKAESHTATAGSIMSHGLSSVTRSAKVHGAPPDVMHDTADMPAGPLPAKGATASELNNGSSVPPASSAGGSQGGGSKRRVEQLQEMVLERELRRIELEEKKLIVETEKLELEKENLELERQKLQLEIGKLQANIRYSHPTGLY